MQTTKNWGWLGQGLAILTLSASLAACGGSSDAGSTTASGASAQGTSPSVSGTPATSVAADNRYSFRPTVAVNAADDQVSFSIQNKPTWAAFAVSTGELSGTPSSPDKGLYPNIVISATAGTAISALPAFSIEVTAQSSSSSSSSGGTSSSSSSSSSSSGGTSSSSSSSNSSGSNVPAAAAAVGYNRQTFGPAVTLNANWVPWNFYGAGAQPAGAVSQNSDGSLFISGLESDTYGATVSTASQTNTAKGWTGTAFGGGAYFEAVLSFTGQGNGPYNNGGPAFYALDVEHTSQGPYAVGWPGMPKNSSGNVYNDFFEVDFMEYDVKEYAYQNGIGNWYGYPATRSGTSNPYQAVGGSAGSVLVAKGTDFSQFHKYGCLWVPATPSTQGYLKFYFDDVQTGATFYWDYYNPNDPSTYPAAPPVNGSTAMSGMDWRHMLPILGTGTDQPMTVQSVSVWQASAANNLTE